MNLTINVDSKAFEKALGELQRQIPYAMSVAMNNTIVAAQGDVVKHAGKVFTIRRPTYLKQSMKIVQFAKKSHLVAVFAVKPVGNSSDSVFTKFEDGTDKRSKTGGKIAIPTVNIRPDATRVVSKARKPRNLKNSFKVKLRSGSEAILQSKGRGKRKTVQVAYILKNQVQIDSRLRFVATAQETIQRTFPDFADAAIAKAIATARLD